MLIQNNKEVKVKNYLASVVVCNQLDYRDEEIEVIEETIKYAMNQYLMPELEATDDNMIFSFPQDPSVKTASIPMLVDITLLGAGAGIRGSSDDIAQAVRNALFSPKEGREVVAIVRFPGNLVGYAPRG